MYEKVIVLPQKVQQRVDKRMKQKRFKLATIRLTETIAEIKSHIYKLSVWKQLQLTAQKHFLKTKKSVEKSKICLIIYSAFLSMSPILDKEESKETTKFKTN